MLNVLSLTLWQKGLQAMGNVLLTNKGLDDDATLYYANKQHVNKSYFEEIIVIFSHYLPSYSNNRYICCVKTDKLMTMYS